ncbi:MAG: hypothetical protein FD152_1075 [Xanthobacteraceae bacterium]|nr:MAG: hypothetical protein FD152_1075 [Xanthobacteraceae bacterium]
MYSSQLANGAQGAAGLGDCPADWAIKTAGCKIRIAETHTTNFIALLHRTINKEIQYHSLKLEAL